MVLPETHGGESHVRQRSDQPRRQTGGGIAVTEFPETRAAPHVQRAGLHDGRGMVTTGRDGDDLFA